MRTGYADFFELRRLNALPRETANYVPTILAMTIVGKNAPAYGLDHLELESPAETDSIEVETPTNLALIADAVDRPLSELKELNPALLKSVAPAGFKVNVPKGMLPLVETAFALVPPAKRDAWRLHRVSQGDSFAGLAKRYSAQPASISLANHEEMPEAGSLVAIPVAYPGDRVAVAKAPVARHHTTGSIAPVASTLKTTVKTKKPATANAATAKVTAAKVAAKPAPKKSTSIGKTSAVAQKSATKAPVRHTASLRAPNS
jgi:membrane-bound lytic murein transglycosylase D